MDRAPGIIGVFLLKPYNPVIVSREDKRQKRGIATSPSFAEAKGTTRTPKNPILSQLGQ